MKKKFLCLILILSLTCIGLIGCGSNNENDIRDDSVFLTLVGVDNADVKISVKQIKQLTPVMIDKAYAIDKFVEGANEYDYHKVKGVYLEEIIKNFTVKKPTLSSVGSIEVKSTDGYGTTLVADSYKKPNSLLVCYEYDGVKLNTNEKSGALRLVANGQAMSLWVKKLDTLIFESGEKSLPEINSIFFLESLTSLAKKVDGFSNSCVKIKDIEAFLKAKGQIVNTDDSSLFVGLDNKNGKFVEYKSFKGYGEFSNGYIVLDAIDDGENKSPQYNYPTLLPGMKISNLMKFNISKSQILCLKKAELSLEKVEGFTPLANLLNSCQLVCSSLKAIDKDGGEVTIANFASAGIKLEIDDSITIKNGKEIIRNVVQLKK